MSVFDHLISPAAIGQQVQSAFRQGQLERQQREVRSALSAFAVNPDDPKAFGMLAQNAPELAIGIRQDRERSQFAAQEREQRLATAAREAQRAQTLEMVRLLDDSVDEPSYQRNLAAAQQLGLDTSAAPKNFDPAWVGQQQVIAQAFIDKPDKVTNDAQMLIEAGYEPGTPQFQQAMTGIINNKYAVEYYDPETKTVRRRAAISGVPGNPAPRPVEPPAGAITDLKRNPSTAGQFDEIFGKGAAARILGQGGPTPPASGTFPPGG